MHGLVTGVLKSSLITVTSEMNVAALTPPK
jgi:hypothetical protein